MTMRTRTDSRRTARRPGHRRRRRGSAGRDRGPGGRSETSGSSASRCSARPTRSWPRAASRPPSATSRRRLLAGPLPRHDGRRQVPEQPAHGPAPRAPRRRTGSASSSSGARVFDRTRDGRILQRPFGGHTHPRLAHVGDRTGLEMIRTLQDRAVAVGITVYMECTITRLITSSDGVTGRVRLLARRRAADRLPGQGRRPRDRRHRQGLRGHLELLGVQRRRPGAGLRAPAPS